MDELSTLLLAFFSLILCISASNDKLLKVPRVIIFCTQALIHVSNKN